MENGIAVYISCPSKDEAEELSKIILDARLAASVNVVNGVQSFLHGQNSVDQVEQSLMILKTQKRLLNSLTEFVQMYHSSEMPEVIALPIIGGSDDYLDWINAQTRDH